MTNVVGKIGFVVVVLLALVGINSAVFRLVDTLPFVTAPAEPLTDTSDTFAYFENRYETHPYLTIAHVTSGIVFMVLGPLQFWPVIRRRWIGFHRACGKVLMVASLVSVLTALAIVLMLPLFGSLASKFGVVLPSLLFLFALVKGYRHIRRYEVAQHREWMIRMFAIGLGISTFRIFLPALMAPPLEASFSEAWDTVVWLGFTVNIFVAEVWINVTREQRATFSGVSTRTSAREPVHGG